MGFQLPAKFAAQQRLERGAVGEAQVEHCAVDFAFPFVALEWPRMSCRLDRLKVAIADAADPQHQSFLVELAVVGIEIDGKFRCTLGRFLSSRSRGIFARRGRFAGGISSFSSISLKTGMALRLFRYGAGSNINGEPAAKVRA